MRLIPSCIQTVTLTASNSSLRTRAGSWRRVVPPHCASPTFSLATVYFPAQHIASVLVGIIVLLIEIVVVMALSLIEHRALM